MNLEKFRIDLHQIPEIGFEEVKTKEYILSQVKDMNCVIHEVQKTGIILYFDAFKEETIAFRADMDALPIKEKTGLPFASCHQNMMHACGHDGHMAILLGLAHYINENKAKLKYNVVLVFQPSEEMVGGAQSIVDSKWLEHYKVRALFGLHIWPQLEKGKVFSRSYELMASSAEVDIEIIGKSTHAASSEFGVDALQIAVAYLHEMYQIEKQLPKDIFRLWKVGKMESGRLRNIISDYTHIYATLRAFELDTFQYLEDHLFSIANKYEEDGAQFKFQINHGYPAVLNDRELFQKVKNVCEIIELEKPVMQAEDFGVYTKLFPSVFFFLGAGNTPMLHNDLFDFDMSILDKGLELFKSLLEIKL